MVEAAALAGFLFGLGIIGYGAVSLPEIVPTHIGFSGNIDAYGSKWRLLAVFFIAMCVNYVFLTAISRYPYWFNYPVNITDKNAPAMYRLGQGIIRGIKLIFGWTLVALAMWFVAAMPDNPKLALDSLITLALIAVPFLTVTAGIIIYYVARILSESK